MGRAERAGALVAPAAGAAVSPRPSEDALIARYLAPLAGPGALGLRDDAGLATPKPGHDLVVTKDMLVAGVHFFADDLPGAIARKALRVNLSDLAAKGAVPLGFMLGLGLPTHWTEPWLQAFVAGLADDARLYACPLIGGDTVATPGPLTLSITAFGEVTAGAMVPRTGTLVGDLLYVTGTIGDAALGLRLRLDDRLDAAWIAALDPDSVHHLRARYLLPEPRLALLPAMKHVRAAMDVSDGFLGDLSKMLALQGLTTSVRADYLPLSDPARAAIALEPSLLQTALSGGDDYEILCAVDPSERAAFEDAAKTAGVSMSLVGIAETGDGLVTVRDASGEALSMTTARYDHFA